MNNYKELNIIIDENICCICLLDSQTYFKQLFFYYDNMCKCNYLIHNECLIEYLNANPNNNRCLYCRKTINITYLIDYQKLNCNTIEFIRNNNNNNFFRDLIIIARYLKYFCFIIANCCIISTTFFIIFAINKIAWNCSEKIDIVKCIENIY